MCQDLRKEIMSVFSHISKRVCPLSKEFHLFRAIYTRILLPFGIVSFTLVVCNLSKFLLYQIAYISFCKCFGYRMLQLPDNI